MNLDDVIARVDTAHVDLQGRVEGAAELAALVNDGALPQNMPAAFVLPLGVRGGARQSITGAYTQAVNEVVGVLLLVEAAGDVTGGRSLPKVDELKDAVIAAIAGWAPADEIGVFVLARGQLLQINAGAIIYQLEFAIDEQLRIIT